MDTIKSYLETMFANLPNIMNLSVKVKARMRL